MKLKERKDIQLIQIFNSTKDLSELENNTFSKI